MLLCSNCCEVLIFHLLNPVFLRSYTNNLAVYKSVFQFVSQKSWPCMEINIEYRNGKAPWIYSSKTWDFINHFDKNTISINEITAKEISKNRAQLHVKIYNPQSIYKTLYYFINILDFLNITQVMTILKSI